MHREEELHDHAGRAAEQPDEEPEVEPGLRAKTTGG